MHTLNDNDYDDILSSMNWCILRCP